MNSIETPTESLNDIPIITCASAQAWEDWLAEHTAEQAGVWIKIAKAGSGIPSVTHVQAIDIALCYGWIDGLRKGYDDKYFLQKFTPRRARSLWSQVNIGKVERLMQEGRMQPAGLAEVEAAKADGRWAAAYAPQRDATPPDDLLRALDKNPEAKAYYETLNKAGKYACTWRLATAKTPATRQRRLEKIMQMLTQRQFK